MTPVVLVLSPPQDARVGSMALAQLKAQAVAHGHPCKVIYASLLHARRLGGIVYGRGANQVMLGEMPFALALFGRGRGNPSRAEIREVCGPYLAGLRYFAPDRDPESVVWALVEHAQATAEEATKRILEEQPVVVGFSCTHRQLAASLLIARMVKSERPGTITIFGGNGDLYGTMGTEALRQFGQIDFLARGDSEYSFAQWLDSVMQGHPEQPVRGIVSRRNPEDMSAPVLTDEEFENLPFADHTDFLEQLAAGSASGTANAILPFEMNRGCWWSMTSKRCLFCAENLADCKTRVRSDARVKAELGALLERHKNISLLCTDTALRKDRYRDLLCWIAGRKEIRHLFVETMASLDETQVASLAEAKVARFQPGIEHLSDRALRHLSKPTSARHNVALLKYCREYGIHPTWNYLMEIPFLEPGELDEQCRRISVLAHLAPPLANPVKIQRTSRLFDKLAGMEGMPLEPDPVMRFCYPLDRPTLMNLSLTFTCPSLAASMKTTAQEEHDRKIQERIALWRTAFRTSYLVMSEEKQHLVLVDTRACRLRIRHVLSGVRKDVYELCSSWKTRASILETLNRGYDTAAIDEAIGALLAANLLLEIDGQFLALATRIHRGMGASPRSMDGLAALGSLSWRGYDTAGRALGTRWTSLPRRLCYYLAGKLLSSKEKASSIIAWRTVRLLAWTRDHSTVA